MSTEKSTLRWMIELFAWISLGVILLGGPVAWVLWSSKRLDSNLYVVRNAEWAGAAIEVTVGEQSTAWGWIHNFRAEKLSWFPKTGLAPLERTFGRLPTYRETVTEMHAVRLHQAEISPAHLKRLQQLLQLGCRFKLETVNLASSGIDAATVAEIGGCKDLKMLNLENCPVTDAMLASLARCGALKSLDLGGSKVTGEGLGVLASLKGLIRLNLRNVRLRPEVAARSFAVFADLEELDLGATAVDDQVCREIARIPRLIRLSLDGTKVGDAGVAALARPSPLVYLDLSGTAVTDVGAAKLAALPQLSHLKLARTGITGKTLEALAALPLLRWLDLRECPGVSAESIAALQKKCPDLTILR